jgi:uncharacterized protein (DUF58 family)
MIPKELARKIRFIQIHTTKVVNDVLAGEYESVFKGRGMEFDEVREYQVGDDVRSIDWNVTARAGKPFVKKYREERELTVLFLVDLSASGSFGSVKETKSELAAELCALLAFAANRNNDKVGLIVFTDQVERFIPPCKGARHVLRVIREILTFRPRRARTDIAGALDYLGRVQSRRAVVFLISDFLAEGFEKSLRVLSRRHDVIAVFVADARESRLPDVGLVELEDAETGERVLIDTASREVRMRYESGALGRARALAEMLRSTGIDQISVETGRPYVSHMMAFFRNRERRRCT